MKAHIITLFPEMFPGTLGHSLAGKALEQGLWSFECINMRDFATDVHKTVDDTPFGGGAGMVIKPDIISQALDSIQGDTGTIYYLSPRGQVLDQALAKEISASKDITLLCGRYEGIDERIIKAYNIKEISIGDYVLSGGELAAQVLLDTCIRLIPTVMGNDETAGEESFENGLLEYPHYTRPAQWTDKDGKVWEVPEVLRSGHHGNIQKWRLEQSETITRERRPDLWEAYIKQKKDK